MSSRCPPRWSLCVLLALPCSLPVAAQQYRSEVRELETPPAKIEAGDPQKLLQTTTDPYARALLLRELAAQAADRREYAQAAKFMEQALATGALSGLAAEEMKKDLAQLYLASGDYQKMVPQLEAQVRAGNVPPEVRVALGAAYLQQQRYKDALPLLRQAVGAVSRPDPSWRRALVAALLGTGGEREALGLLAQLVREDPRQPDDWLRLAALHLKFNQRERALSVMEVAQRLGYLDSPVDRLRLVTLTAQLGAPFEAGSLLQSWMESEQIGSDAANRKLLAKLWLAAREDSLAVPALERALEVAPDAELWGHLARLRMDREEYAEAAQAAQQWQAAGGRAAEAQLLLGLARYQQADVDAALEAFRAAQTAGGQSARLATEWVKYLQTGLARDQALAAALDRRSAGSAEAVQLSSRLLGGRVDLAAGSAAASQASGAVSGGSGELTPVGAERAGNRSGDIPPWTGGLLPAERPASFQPGKPLVHPFPNDRPLYTITAANAARYREQLAPGHLAMLEKYPSYRMPVYITRRSVAYPQPIYDATAANRGRARLLGPDALADARLGFPFPQPQSGVEIMWNHRTRYRGDTVESTYSQAVVLPNGSFSSRNKQVFRVLFRYSNIASPVDIAQQNQLAYGITHISETGRSPDFVALFHESANSLENPRNVWVLITRIGRMLRIPPVGYDQPFPGSDGLEFIDMVDMYNGAFDRYTWKLVGKRELLIPYNAYALNDGRYRNADLLTPHHLNPEGARYELHRVWVVEATERGGKRHSFGKRVFYVDEDSWTVVLVENHDPQGQLWRFQEGHLVPEYDVQAVWTRPVLTYDLKDGRYFANRLFAEDEHFRYGVPMTDQEFLPAAVKRKYSK
ncbi:MAG: DUF1329 domain-containing protein [Gammaproteobacteria bacterium]